MVLTKRERVIAIITGVVVAALIGNAFVLDPMLGKLEQVENEKLLLLAEVNEAQDLFDRRRLMERKWKAMLSDGMRSDSEAESRVARVLDDWSEGARLVLSSVKPERVASEKGLKEMTFSVVGTGSLEAVARFLWQVETTALPVKVKDMQLSAMSESGDSMSLQLRVSAIYFGTPERPDQGGQPQPQQPGTNDEDTLL
jgi:Tfp pilus assembly protein PilO